MWLYGVLIHDKIPGEIVTLTIAYFLQQVPRGTISLLLVVFVQLVSPLAEQVEKKQHVAGIVERLPGYLLLIHALLMYYS